MKILVFSWRDPKHSLAGGAEQVMHEHMKGWVEAGHEVTLFSSRIVGYEKNEEVLDGIKIIRKSFQILGVQVAAFFWYLFGKHERFDLVVDQFHGIPFFTPLFVRKTKLAVLQEVAREVWFKNHLPKPLNWIVGVIGYLNEPLIFLFYKGVSFMVGSESASQDLVKMGIPVRNITTIPHGVIIPRSKRITHYAVKKQKEEDKIIVFLGALAKDKGIEDAIKCFAILDRGGEFRFWVIGRGGEPYLSQLRDLAHRLGIKVKFWGFVSQEKKFELLARAHVMVNPSIREGWGLVNIEANAMGTPVVAYNSPGLVDSVVDSKTGIICQENSPEAMAKEVARLLENKNLLDRLSVSAIKWARSFSWEKSKKKSLMLLDKVLATHV